MGYQNGIPAQAPLVLVMSSYMNPRLAFDDIGYCRWGYLVATGQRSPSFAQCRHLPYFKYVAFCQFGIAMIAAFWGNLTTFLVSICVVLSLRAKKQMRRIYARRVVASMAHASVVRFVACGYRAIVQFIGDTMGKVFLAMPLELTVAIVPGSLPKPALVWFARGAIQPKRFFYGVSIRRDIVTSNKLHRLTRYPSLSELSMLCNLGFLAATAHAKAAWIWARFADEFAAAMPAHVKLRMPFDMAVSFVVVMRWVGFLSTTTMAIAVRDFVGGVVRGMIIHVNSPFSTLTMPPNDSSRCGGDFIGRCSFIIAQDRG
jgi:hypothetical protein